MALRVWSWKVYMVGVGANCGRGCSSLLLIVRTLPKLPKYGIKSAVIKLGDGRKNLTSYDISYKIGVSTGLGVL